MDFSQLTDEQLLQLIEAALAETISRGTAVVDAAREVMLSMKEKEEIKAAAAARAKAKLANDEAEKIAREEEERLRRLSQQAEQEAKAEAQRKSWLTKKDQAQRMIDLLGAKDIWINVWKGSGETRVYINDGEPFARKTIELGVYYVTGNTKFPPKKLAESHRDIQGLDAEKKAELIALLQEISKSWNVVKFSCKEAVKYEG